MDATQLMQHAFNQRAKFGTMADGPFGAGLVLGVPPVPGGMKLLVPTNNEPLPSISRSAFEVWKKRMTRFVGERMAGIKAELEDPSSYLNSANPADDIDDEELEEIGVSREEMTARSVEFRANYRAAMEREVKSNEELLARLPTMVFEDLSERELAVCHNSLLEAINGERVEELFDTWAQICGPGWTREAGDTLAFQIDGWNEYVGIEVTISKNIKAPFIVSAHYCLKGDTNTYTVLERRELSFDAVVVAVKIFVGGFNAARAVSR